MKRITVKTKKLQSVLDWISGWREVAAIIIAIIALLIVARIYYSL